MRIDSSKSTAENMLALVNAEAKFRYQPGAFTMGDPGAITPGPGNGMNNTQLLLSGLEAGGTTGSAIVRYTRQTVAENRPSAGNVVYSTNADTQASIHERIAEKHRLVLEELVFTDPFEPPPGSFEANYTVAAKANSKLYAPGSMTIKVINNDALPAKISPRWLFPYAGMADTRKAYDLKTAGFTIEQLSPASGNYTTYGNTDKDNFAQLLNYVAGRPGLLKAKDFTLSAPVYQQGFVNLPSIYGLAYYHAINFDVGAESQLSEGGVLYYSLYQYNAFAGIPQAIKDDQTINRGRRVFEYLKLPVDKIVFQAYNPSFPDRVYYSIPDSVIFLPTGSTYFTLI